MRVDNSISVYAGTGQEKTYADKADGTSDKERKTIFAGDMQKAASSKDMIQQKKEAAQQQALKIVREAWDNDRAIDDLVNTSKAHAEELRQANKESLDNLKDINSQREELYAAYGIEDGDLDKLSAKEFTEYQQRSQELNKAAQYESMNIYRNNLEIISENAVVRGIREEHSKMHLMVDAQEEAKEVLEGARDEIIGMVMDDAKSHVDEEQEKRQEQAEAIKEKKEEQEELLEKHKEKEKQQEDITEDMDMSGDEMLGLNMIQAGVQKGISGILKDMNLVVEDIKGSMVDMNV